MNKKIVALLLVISLIIVMLGAYLYWLKKSELSINQFNQNNQYTEIQVLIRKGTFPTAERLNEIASSVGGEVLLTDDQLGMFAIGLNSPHTEGETDHLIEYLKKQYPEVESAFVPMLDVH